MIQELDPWVGLEPEVVHAMLALGGVGRNVRHADLGAGDGRFCAEALAMGAKSSIGYELSPTLVAQAQALGRNVTTRDVFELSVGELRQIDVLTAWFTVEPGTTQLLQLLYERMLAGMKLVLLYNSRVQYPQEGGQVEQGIPAHVWQPTQAQWVIGNKILLYVR